MHLAGLLCSRNMISLISYLHLAQENLQESTLWPLAACAVTINFMVSSVASVCDKRQDAPAPQEGTPTQPTTPENSGLLPLTVQLREMRETARVQTLSLGKLGKSVKDSTTTAVKSTIVRCNAVARGGVAGSSGIWPVAAPAEGGRNRLWEAG